MRRTGQWLRFVGQLIELVGVVGVVRERGGHATSLLQIPGGPVISIAWAAVAVGLVVFLSGWILIAAQRPRRPTP